MLKNVQEIFWNFISAPEGVEAAEKSFSGVQLEEWFRGDEKLPTTRRLDIYANMYFWRIHDAVLEDFPAVAKIIGPENWNNLMTDYLLQHPSQTPLLQYVGRHLPDFLKAYEPLQQWPYLSDLARLEWEKAMMFEAVDNDPVTFPELQKIESEKWPTMRFELISALKILELEWDVGLATGSPEKKQTFIKIWRKDFTVFDRRMEPEEKKALEILYKGHDFTALCESLFLPEEAVRFLADWVQSGLIAKVLV